MENIDLKSIGERISMRRKLMGITQERLAEQMDVSVQMISNLERGVKAVKIDNLVKLSRILNVTTDYILTGDKTDGDINALSERIARLSADDLGLVEMTVSYLLNKKK